MAEEEASTVNDFKSSPSSCKEKNSSLMTSSTAEEDVQLDYQENEEDTNPRDTHNGNSSEPTARLDDSSNGHKTELQSPDTQNIEDEEELVQQDALEDLETEDNLELRSLNDEGDAVDEPESGEVKNVEEKKRPRTPPSPCPDADEADEDEEEELQEEVADDENEEKGNESTEEADPEHKAGDLKKKSRSKERDRSSSRRDRSGVPKAYQMSRKPERRNGGGMPRPRRRLPLKNGATDSVEFRLATNRRLRLKRLRAARLQRVTELGRRRGNNSSPPARRGIGRRSDDFRDKRRRSRSRSPLRRGRLSPNRRAPIPSLMSTRVRTPPSRRFNDSRRYAGYSGRRSRSPPPRRMSTDRRPLRRPEAAGSSRPAFVGNDQYRIYINNNNSDRRPRRERSPPPRHGRFEPYNSRDKGSRMGSVRRDKIPSLLSLRTSPPPVMRGGSSRRSPMRSRGRLSSPPLRSYVRGEDRNRPRSSRFPNKCPPRQRSP